MQVLDGFILASFFCAAFALLRRSLKTSQFLDLFGLSLPLGSALILILVGTVGRLTHHFDSAYWISGILCLGMIACSALFPARAGAQLQWKFHPRFSDLPTLFLILGSTFLIAKVSLRYAIFDEFAVQGHISITRQILNGTYPPTYPSFKDLPYAYHFGFNLLSAVWAKALGLPAYAALDAAGIFLWISLWAVSLSFFRAMGIARKLWPLALAWCFLTGGLAWLLAKYVPGFHGTPEYQFSYFDSRRLVPNFVFIFFQHPVILGAVLFVSFLRFLREYGKERTGCLFLMIFLVALSLGHVMFFTTALATLLGVALLRPLGFFGKDVLSLRHNFAFVVVSLLGAFLLGGFFQWIPDGPGSSVLWAWPPGYLKHEFWGHATPIDFLQALVWYLSSFGLLLFILPFGIYQALKKKEPVFIFLAAFSLLCFLIPQFFRYRLTWDIVKWFFGFDLGSRLLVALALLPWISAKAWRQALAWFVVILSMVSPVYFLWDLSFKPKTFMEANTQLKVNESQSPLFESIGQKASDHAYIWSSFPTDMYLAWQTGKPIFELDYVTTLMSIPPKLLEERKEDFVKLLSSPSLDLLDQFQIEWIVFNCQNLQKLPITTQNFLTELRVSPRVTDFSTSDNGSECIFALQLHPET